MRPASFLFLSLAAASVAPAQYAEIGVSVGYSRFQDGEFANLRNDGGLGDIYSYGDGVRVGARMSFDLRSYFAHELAYSWQRAPFRVESRPDGDSGSLAQTNSNIHHYYYSLVAHATRRDSRVRPFVAGGGGMSNFVPPGFSALSRGQTKFGYCYGGGVKFRLTERYGLRFDVRDHVTGKPFFPDEPGRLHNVETSATFSFLF